MCNKFEKIKSDVKQERVNYNGRFDYIKIFYVLCCLVSKAFIDKYLMILCKYKVDNILTSCFQFP